MTRNGAEPGLLASVPPEVLRELRNRYTEPHRAYHTWRHIEHLLGLFEEIERCVRNQRAVLLAILFHDAVYDPKRSDNEERSGRLLVDLAAGDLDPETVVRARLLIDATKRHELLAEMPAQEVSDTELFLDMDLSILGAPQQRFDEYERQIRAEYAHLSDDAYRIGRSKVLNRFLQRQPLFLSAWGRGRFADQATVNLQRALVAVKQG
jgi:predicted metal-dependent HD superfamily phosphohydrolase